jgi:beta-lactamase superfamily II metal-dependent hydrolase
MRLIFALVVTVFAAAATAEFAAPPPVIQARTSKTLDIYVIDVEGGNATLLVAPSGESLLIDTGNAAPGAVRDASRIMDAIKDAGIVRIDKLITTHWHGDHYGGMEALASRIPIREFIDHGANVQPTTETDKFLQITYPQLYAKSKHTVAKAGDRISMTGLDVRVLTSAGETIKTPLTGAGKPNPYCASFKTATSIAEDPQSVGIHIAFGQFRAIHLGDLTRDKEFELMCPNDRVGPVDVLLGMHHGQPSSNSEVLIHAIHPRVAIMNNGIQKGGGPEVMKTIHSSPGLEDLWQLHFSQLSGQEYTVPGMFIANTFDEPQSSMPVAPLPAAPPGATLPAAPKHDGIAYWIKVSASTDGSFTVTNSRNQFTKAYGKLVPRGAS